METITYEPIKNDFENPATKGDLYNLYRKIESLYGREETPEKIIQLENL